MFRDLIKAINRLADSNEHLASALRNSRHVHVDVKELTRELDREYLRQLARFGPSVVKR